MIWRPSIHPSISSSQIHPSISPSHHTSIHLSISDPAPAALAQTPPSSPSSHRRRHLLPVPARSAPTPRRRSPPPTPSPPPTLLPHPSSPLLFSPPTHHRFEGSSPRRQEHEGLRHVPERPRGRQGRHRAQGLGCGSPWCSSHAPSSSSPASSAPSSSPSNDSRGRPADSFRRPRAGGPLIWGGSGGCFGGRIRRARRTRSGRCGGSG